MFLIFSKIKFKTKLILIYYNQKSDNKINLNFVLKKTKSKEIEQILRPFILT